MPKLGVDFDDGISTRAFKRCFWKSAVFGRTGIACPAFMQLWFVKVAQSQVTNLFAQSFEIVRRKSSGLAKILFGTAMQQDDVRRRGVEAGGDFIYFVRS